MREFTSLEDAKKYVEDNREEGVDCPCCNRFNKVYRRKFHTGMALALIYVYRISKEQDHNWFHLTDLFVKKFKIDAVKLDYSKLGYFGLIRQKREKVEGKKDSGYWKLTNKGMLVVKNKLAVPSHVSIFNGVVVGFSKESVYLKNTLDVKFNYDELMRL